MLNKIVLHQVGGRGGSTSLPFDAAFKDDFIFVLYDPDTTCIEHMKNNARSLYSHHITLPYCLGNKNEESYLKY